MPSLFQALVIMPGRIRGLLRRRRPLVAPARPLPIPLLLPAAPQHVNGRAMTIQEAQVWQAMQQVISTHWPERRAVPDANVRSYPPADPAWGGMLQVYGTERVILRSDTGDWEAEISPEGRVGVPHQRP